MRKKKFAGGKSLEVDIISSGLEVLLRLERAADRTEKIGTPFPSLPPNDPRQRNIQNYVLNALQWVAESQRQGPAVKGTIAANTITHPDAKLLPSEMGTITVPANLSAGKRKKKRRRKKGTTRPVSPKLGKLRAD